MASTKRVLDMVKEERWDAVCRERALMQLKLITNKGRSQLTFTRMITKYGDFGVPNDIDWIFYAIFWRWHQVNLQRDKVIKAC